MENGTTTTRRRRRRSPRPRRPCSPRSQWRQTGGDEGAARQGQGARKPLPKPDAARHATHVGEFYENDENDARTRHARGYDPLDKHAQRVEAEVDDAKERRDALYASRVLFFAIVASTAC